jgi:hypothetical protein
MSFDNQFSDRAREGVDESRRSDQRMAQFAPQEVDRRDRAATRAEIEADGCVARAVARLANAKENLLALSRLAKEPERMLWVKRIRQAEQDLAEARASVPPEAAERRRQAADAAQAERARQIGASANRTAASGRVAGRRAAAARGGLTAEQIAEARRIGAQLSPGERARMRVAAEAMLSSDRSHGTRG